MFKSAWHDFASMANNFEATENDIQIKKLAAIGHLNVSGKEKIQ